MAEREQVLVGQFFAELSKLAQKVATRESIPVENARKAVVEKALNIRKPIDEVAEKTEAQSLVDGVKLRGQSVSESMKKWSRENRYRLPIGSTSQEHQDNIRDFIKVVNITGPELSWLAGLDPDTLQSPQAAEFVARLALLPPNLRKDPNILFREAARLSCSLDSSTTKAARTEVNKLLNQTILHIRTLKNGGANFSLDNEELTYALRGFVLYDETLDGANIPGDGSGVFKQALVQEAKQHAAKGMLPLDQEQKAMSGIQDRITRGNGFKIIEFTDTDGVIRHKRESIEWEPEIAENYAKRITHHTDILNRRMNAAKTLTDFEPESVTQLFEVTSANIYRITTEESKRLAVAANTLSPKEKELYEDEIIRSIHKLLSFKMDQLEQWHREGISTPITELDSWLRLLKDVNPKKYEHINDEEEALRWLHGMFLALRKGPSPTDTKEYIANAQDYDDNKLHKALCHFPGVEKAFQLLEKHQDNIIGSEINKSLWEETLAEIAAEMESDGALKQLLAKQGITPQDAIRVAHRFWLEAGRDGEAYWAYLYRHNLLHYEPNPDTGLVEGYLDPRAPKMWNPLRLTTAPEALWGFFNIGGFMKGDVKEITAYIPGRDNAYQEVQFKTPMGAGVGADVIRSLLKNKWDLALPDYFSRRHNYIFDAWIEKITRDDYINNVTDPARQVELQEAKRIIKETNLPVLQQTDRPLWKLRKLQAEFIKSRENVLFAKSNGTPTKDVKGQADMLKEIEDLQKELGGRADLLVELDDIRAKYPAITQDASTHDAVIYGDPRFKDQFGKPLDFKGRKFYPTMEHYKLSEVNWDDIQRSAEHYRGHVRDLISGLSVQQSVLDFVNNPSVQNFQKLDISSMTGYTFPDVAQIKLIQPAYLALWDVQRGKGPWGYDVGFGFVKQFKSKYARIYNVGSLTDLDLYKIGLEAITRRGMTEDQLFNLRGRYRGFLRDKGLLYADPVSLLVLFGAMAQEEAKQIAKDVEKQ